MSETSRLPRQLPATGGGRTRDGKRDQRIIAATLDLLSERGPDNLSIESVAARAGVGKTTVYRRWATLDDLQADVIDSIPFPAYPAKEHDELEADLAEGLAAASGCLDECRRRTIASILESAHRRPDMADGLRHRFMLAVRDAINDALTRESERGELPPRAREVLDSHDATEYMVAISMIIQMPSIYKRPLEQADFTKLVHEVLLPLLTRT